MDARSPTEVVRNLKEDLIVLEKGGDAKKLEKVILLFGFVYLRPSDFFCSLFKVRQICQL